MSFIKKYKKEILIFLCIILIFIHGFLDSYFRVDNVTILLIVLIFLIPYIPLIKKVKFGEFEAELEQGTSTPLPPITQNIESRDKFTIMEKKILSTLYKYQIQSFGNDKSKRFTFIITPFFKIEYPDYLAGVSSLLKRGFISVSPENNHCSLTNEGLDYIEKNKSKIYDEKLAYTF